MISLSFHGAAGTVTGSKYLITVNDKKALIDCGMFQGDRELRQRNWRPMPFKPADIAAVIATHSHIDHIGYLPRLVRDGFMGNIYATPPTFDISKISLLDSAHLMEEDAAFRNKKGLTRHKKALPLFTADDVEKTIKYFIPVEFGDWVDVCKGIKFRFHIAGHILGAASVECLLNDGNRQVSILFSGDIGRYAVPLVIDPAPPPRADYIVCESTYGGHLHPPEDPFFELAKILDEIIENKRILLIPAFAIGRTQQITYMINTLRRLERIPPIDIHLDSPMAIKATDIYRKYKDYHTVDLNNLSGNDKFLSGDNVFIHRTRKSSQELNKLKGPGIIISASGMLTGGRILHHLINRLPNPKTILALVGFMARGTLGRKIFDGEKQVYIHKMPVDVKAKAIKMFSLSGHADYYEIGHWLEDINEIPKKVFITHGEPDESKAMANYLKEQRNWSCEIPVLDQTVEL